MEVSVVIPVFNAAATLDRQLEALARQRWEQPWELIVADNGSTDQSLAICERYRNRIRNFRVVDASARRGAGYARNVGVAHARGSSLVFCDADDEICVGYVEAMGEGLAQHTVVVAEPDKIKLNSPWLRESRFDVAGSREFFEIVQRRFPVVGSGQLGVRRTLFDALGGFEDAAIADALCEDDDFSVKLALFGERPRPVKEAIFHYRLRNSLRGLYTQARAYARGHVVMYYKYSAIGYPEPPQIPWKAILGSLPKTDARAALARCAWQCGAKVGWDSMRSLPEKQAIAKHPLELLASALVYRKGRSAID